MKRKVSYEPKFNFHNSSPINIVIDDEDTYEWSYSGKVYCISKAQARRIEKHFCGMSDCGCPKGDVTGLNQEGTEFGVPVKKLQLKVNEMSKIEELMDKALYSNEPVKLSSGVWLVR